MEEHGSRSDLVPKNRDAIGRERGNSACMCNERGNLINDDSNVSPATSLRRRLESASVGFAWHGGNIQP
jgi:hypothetical protein